MAGDSLSGPALVSPVLDLAVPPLSKSPNNLNISLGPKLSIRSSCGSALASDPANNLDSSEYLWGPVSPSVQEKIDQLKQQSSGSKFFDMTQLDQKRKPDGSPESDLSRREKKILRSAE